ncbi:hypothetical protein D9613_000687 [Agrocybe pediades]|uniref:RING-type domain-containing protein n=1 Tax=Agrocybe pediades TaxID=84607 RepID=A0A8H4VS22_9AGAR|nr:hypothetical protein D9613_000687 [Agrocybe pediades]
MSTGNADSPTQLQESALRRVRSTGDIPIARPERAHLADSSPLPPSQRPHFVSSRSSHVPSSNIVITSAGQPASSSARPTLPRQSNNQNSPRANRSSAAADEASLDSFPIRLLSFFGVGRRASRRRKILSSLIWKLSWGFVQFVVVVTMLILVGVHFKSVDDPTLSEWTACDRPLGTWASLWVVRDVLASILAYWDYKRDTARFVTTPPTDPEGNANASRRTTGPTAPGSSSNAQAQTPAPTEAEMPNLPHTRLYSRLTLLSSLMTLSWFLTAHILEYTSINTCRRTSPHLWWLVFGILSIMYLMVLEVLIIGLVVLVIAPILFVFWNIVIICLGRHPLQNPGMIKPEVGKLSQNVVEQIPLVIYIPPPPEDERDPDMTYPYEYPPTKTKPVQSKAPSRRFKLLNRFNRPRKNGNEQGSEDKGAEKEMEKGELHDENAGNISWPEHWEQGEYPFVALDGNRAACAICLMDFEEPQRRVRGGSEPVDAKPIPQAKEEVRSKKKNRKRGRSSASPSSPTTGEDQVPTLADAGDGAQPLRLLACSHVFHQSCLDPWLTQVSGRCPVCQRPVEIPESPNKKKRSR